MKHIEHICGLCSNNQSILCFYKWNFPIVKCSKCSFMETVISNDLDLSSIYTEDYYDGGRKDGYVDYESSQVVLEKEFEALLLYLEKYTTGHDVLVEIGCAKGFLLNKAKSFYDKVIGFEISAPAIDYCLKHGLEVYSSEELNNILPKIPPIDVLIMLDTIEHVKNPKVLIQLLFRKMNNGGIIILTTGDVDSLYSRLTGKLWRLMTPPQHLSFFSVNSMSKMLTDAGFEIVITEKPWKWVPVKLVLYQILSRLGFKKLGFIKKLPNTGIPVNLFDAMKVVARKPI
jgi:SAM-dependent methyltransferase